MSDDLEPLSPTEGVERFIRHRKPSVRKSTLQNARTRLRYFLEWCDDREIENLNTLSGRDLADFVDWRRDQVKPITLQKQLSSIRMALEYWADLEAVEDGLREKVHAPELPDGSEARDVHLKPDRAKTILRYFDDYHPGAQRHVVVAILWRAGMRRGALRAIDVDDLLPEENAIDLYHRPETDTPLKNGEAGERCVYLGPRWYAIVNRYLENPDRLDVTDEHGRRPLITTEHGRPTGDTIYKWVCATTQPCNYGQDCPHDKDPATCSARGTDGSPAQCPSARSPHAVRRGAITHHLNSDVTPEVVSERMDVSLDVLYQHYDARSEREKMQVRRQNLPE